MKTSVIRYRVADFLRENAPFHYFTMEEVLAFAGTGRVAFHEDLVYLFEKGEPRSETVWVIQQGRIEIWNKEGSEDRMIDLLGPGDILGLRSGADETVWPVTAKTATEVILYGFDLDTLVSYGRNHSEAMAFLDAATAATTPGGKASLRSPQLNSEREKGSWICRDREFSIHQESDSDRLHFRSGAPASAGKTVPEYFLELMRARASRLILTADATKDGEELRVITEEDLAAESGRNPALLLRKALGAGTEKQLIRVCDWMKEFIEQELAGPSVVPFLCEVVSLWNDALIESATRLALEQVSAKPHDFSLLVFGSTARKEVLETGVSELGLVIEVEPDMEEAVRELADKLGEVFKVIFDIRPLVRVMGRKEWCKFYADRIREPILNEYYLTREMLDFRCVYGNPEISTVIRQAIDLEIKREEGFLRLLAHDTIANQPPLTWLKDSIVQADGTESSQLDLDKTVLTPLADSARVVALANQGVNISGTINRLDEASVKYPQYEAILTDAAAGWREAVYVKALLNSERQSGPGSLSRLDQRLLKMSFDSTRQFLELTTSLFRTVEA